jgi:hypothetical protein
MNPSAQIHAGSERPDSKKSVEVLRCFFSTQPIPSTNAK